MSYIRWQNSLTELLGIHYPIIQAPMLGVVTPEIVAMISNAGGLGSLPVGGLPPDKTLELIKKTKSLTDKPFAVNIFAHSIPSIDVESVTAMNNLLVDIGKKNHLTFNNPEIENLKFYSYQEQIDILISENIPIVSFIFGILTDSTIKKLKQNNVILIGTATCVKEAQILEEKGIDVISAQGIEAGGHRGTFLDDESLPQIGLMSLVPQMVDKVKVPVLAAGGINDGRTIRAAFALGALGVQIGSAFIASNESVAAPVYKKAMRSAKDTDTKLTRTFTGKWARAIENEFIKEVDKSGLAIPEFPIQASLTGLIRAAAQNSGNTQCMIMLAGQSAAKAAEKSVESIFRDLVVETEKAMF